MLIQQKEKSGRQPEVFPKKLVENQCVCVCFLCCSKWANLCSCVSQQDRYKMIEGINVLNSINKMFSETECTRYLTKSRITQVTQAQFCFHMISNEVEISGYREAKREIRGYTQNTTIQSSNIITLLSTIGDKVDLSFASINYPLQREESCFVLSNFLRWGRNDWQ